MKLFTTIFLVIAFYAVQAQTGFQEFTSSGVFTIPAGVTEVYIEVVGSGGNGGYNGTGGGGGGGYASGMYAVTPLDIINITIGAAGGGPATGSTHAGGFITATGGNNGVSVPNPEIGGGGTGGYGIGGNISNYTGGNGGGGYYTYFGGGGGGAAGPTGNGLDGGNTIAWTGICNTPGGDGGLSGGAPGGDGGKGAGFTDDFCNVTDPASPGLNYGGGGGGGNGNGGAPSNGSGGYCKISWCALDVSTTLSADTISVAAADAIYQWINCDSGDPVVGATSQNYVADVTGNYAVIVSDGFCTDTSDCVFVEIIENGIDGMHVSDLIISPNPFSDYITVANAKPDAIYFLFNSMGQIVWKGNNIELQNFSNLHPGIYFLKIESDGGRLFRSLVKE